MAKRTQRKKIEETINKLGHLTQPQAKKLGVALRFRKLNPPVDITSASTKELFEMSFEEFKSLFGSSALALTAFQSSRRASRFLKGEYKQIIVKALIENKPNVSITGIEMIQFHPEYYQDVKRYLLINKIKI